MESIKETENVRAPLCTGAGGGWVKDREKQFSFCLSPPPNQDWNPFYGPP